MTDKHINEAAERADDPTDGSDAQLIELGYKPELRRALGGLSSFAIQFSTICFSGAIFIALTVGFGQVGPLMVWTYIGAGILQVVVAFCIAELCSAYPLAGGIYQIVTRQGGRFLGWQTGWLIQLAHIASLALGTIGLTPLIAAWFGFEDLTHLELVGVSGVLILLTTMINLLSVKLVARINNVGVAAELVAAAVMTFGVLIGMLFFGRHHQPGSFLLSDAGVVPAGESIVLPLLYSTLLAAFIASGFDVSGTASEETHDAAESVPRQAVRANIAALVIGGSVLLMLMLAVPSVDGVLGSTSPVRYILSSAIGPTLAEILEVAAVLSLFVNGVILQLAGARVLWAQARDEAFVGSKRMRRLNRERIPVNGVLVAGLVAFLLTIYSSVVNILAAILAVTWASAYLLALVVGMRTRSTLPPRPFNLKHGRLMYSIAIIWSAVVIGILAYQEPRKIGLGLLGLIVIGLVLYFVAGPARAAKSKDRTPDPATP